MCSKRSRLFSPELVAQCRARGDNQIDGRGSIAKGNLHQNPLVRKTEKASLVEEFMREKLQLLDVAERAQAVNDMLREEAKSAHGALRDTVGGLQSFKAPPPHSGEKEEKQRRINYKNPG
jgi:hypothetical protein